MISQPPIRKPFNCFSATVSGRNFSSNRKRVWHPVRKEFHDAMKAVEVTCLNQVFSGIGFRNDNGGLEFFSEGLRNRLTSKAREDLDAMRSRLAKMEDEYDSVSSEILRGRLHITDWQQLSGGKKRELSGIKDDIDATLARSKSGEITEQDMKARYKVLGAERRRVEHQLADLRREISGYRSNLRRQNLLSICIEELRQHIDDKERELSVSNTFTIEQSGILTFPFIKGVRSKSCCLFADVMDYTAFVYLSGTPGRERYPKCCDGIVLNAPCNFSCLLSEIERSTYEYVYCFFPDTILYKTIEETIISRNGGKAVSMGVLYEGYVSLHEYAREKENYSPLKTKKK